jgi:hypothetical protein
LTAILVVAFALVAVLCVLIVRINVGEHYAPQAYYRRKQGGAPLAGGFESLGPRPRKRAPSEPGADAADAKR